MKGSEDLVSVDFVIVDVLSSGGGFLFAVLCWWRCQILFARREGA